MLFSSPTKTFFIEENEHTRVIARTSAGAAPLVIEEIQEVPKTDLEGFANALKHLQPKRAASGYVHATCSIFSPNRVVRRVTLETKRLKEPNYFAEVSAQQLRIEPDKHSLSVLLPSDGTDFDEAATGAKEALFCGLPSDEVIAAQDAFLSQGVYPERLELGSVALLGGLVDYVQLTKCKAPTLVLELGQNVTQSHIVGPGGVEASRSIPQGIAGMVPVVQKELGLKDEESAKKLFYSNTFDFGGMGPLLVKRLIKELQSSIGFYEVQTGQSIGQVICFLLPAKLVWLENAVAASLGVGLLKLNVADWARYRRITFSEKISSAIDPRWFSLLSVMARYNIADTDNAIPAEENNEAAQPQVAAWHPNFRNYERLPDVKTVRTAFFANAVAVAVAITAALWVAYREYQYSLIRSDIEVAQADVARDKGPSDQAVVQFRKFQADEKKVREIADFVGSKPSVAEMYVTLGNTLVNDVALTHIEIAPSQIGLRGVVHGPTESTSSIASNYIDALKADAFIGKLCSGVTQVNATRNPQTGWLNIELALRFKGGK